MGPKGVPDTKTDKPTDRRSKHQLTNSLWYLVPKFRVALHASHAALQILTFQNVAII
jgi:hypothetical protein